MTDTTSAKKSSEEKIASEAEKIQEQVLDAIKRSQDAALQAVHTWSEGVAKFASNLPELPKLPVIEALPKPHEVSDQFFDFAQKLISTQQEFVKKLIDALPGHDESAK